MTRTTARGTAKPPVSTAAGAALIVLLAMGVGCGTKPQPVASPPPALTPNAQRPTPTPTPTPQFQGTLSGAETTLYDRDGKKVATVRARAADLAPGERGQIATSRGGSATLFKNGVASATLTADTIGADQKSRTVQAKGHVVVQSLEQKGAPTVHADVVGWNHDADRIDGKGNVRATMEGGWEVPADSFTANTDLKQMTVQGNGQPAVGNL